jgi:hypothetical protein
MRSWVKRVNPLPSFARQELILPPLLIRGSIGTPAAAEEEEDKLIIIIIVTY